MMYYAHASTLLINKNTCLNARVFQSLRAWCVTTTMVRLMSVRFGSEDKTKTKEKGDVAPSVCLLRLYVF